MSKKLFQGKWKITDMEAWEVESGWYIEFDSKGSGSFHFCCVNAEIDYGIDNKKSPNRADFSFYGDDEGHEVFGRGFAVIDGKNLSGKLVFHQGEESGFCAKKKIGKHNDKNSTNYYSRVTSGRDQ